MGPSWAVWGGLGALLGRLGLSWGILGPSWAVLGPSWGRLGPSWSRLGVLRGRLGPSWGLVDSPQVGVSTGKNHGFLSMSDETSWGRLEQSSGRPRPFWERLGLVLGPYWAVLGPSWDRFGLSWERLDSPQWAFRRVKTVVF